MNNNSPRKQSTSFNGKFSRSRSTSNKNSPYLMYGKHCVLAALSNPKRYTEKIFCNNEVFNEHSSLISKYSHQITSNDKLASIIGQQQTNHQGIIAKVESIFIEDIKQIDCSNPNCRIAILDQVTDPQNIGSILRSAAAFNIQTIIMPRDNSPAENATIAKAACGALEQLQIIQVTNLKAAIEYLKKHGVWIIGLAGNATQALHNELLSGKIAIVLGSEDKGLRKLTQESCDFIVKINISSAMESLNVGNAATIAFFLAFQNT